MILRLSSFVLISCSFLAFLTSCSSDRKKEAQQQQKAGGAAGARNIKADAYIVKTELLSDNLETPGSIVANESTDIHPEVAGRITGIFFTEGAFVNKGAMLVKLNDADLQAQKRKLQIQLQVAKQNENRTAQLLKIQGISKQDYETSALNVSNVNADLAVVETQIEKTNIRAPFSGKLGLRLVSLGAYISPTTTLTSISQLSQLKIDFTVPERYIPQISLGQMVSFRIDGNRRNFVAKILATQSNITENSRTLQVRAAVQGVQEGLVPGNFAKVIINFEPDPNAIVVPTQAIIPQARGKKVYLFNGGVAKFVDVTTGLRDSVNIQITGGLKAGDTVLVTSLLTLKPNSKVTLGRIINGPKKQDHTKTNGADSTRQNK
jgi:membrane fusion protein (multidrug efflux system)